MVDDMPGLQANAPGPSAKPVRRLDQQDVATRIVQRPRRRDSGRAAADDDGAAGHAQAAASSRFSPAMRIIAFCSFSNARTSIWRTRSRLTP